MVRPMAAMRPLAMRRAPAGDSTDSGMARAFQPVLLWLLSLLLLTTLLLVPSPPAAASPDAGGDTAQRNWYVVEVLLFRQWERGGRHAERWPDPSPPDPHHYRWFSPIGCGGSGSGRAAGGVRIHCLPPEQRELGNQWGALRRAEAYVPIHYAAWIQPGLRERDSVAVPIPFNWQPPTSPPEPTEFTAPGERPNTSIYGLVRIVQEQQLHAMIDLRLNRAHYAGDDLSDEELERASLHRLRETRPVRLGEIHYFDHPAMGVLLRIRRGEPPS